MLSGGVILCLRTSLPFEQLPPGLAGLEQRDDVCPVLLPATYKGRRQSRFGSADFHAKPGTAPGCGWAAVCPVATVVGNKKRLWGSCCIKPAAEMGWLLLMIMLTIYEVYNVICNVISLFVSAPLVTHFNKVSQAAHTFVLHSAVDYKLKTGTKKILYNWSYLFNKVKYTG